MTTTQRVSSVVKRVAHGDGEHAYTEWVCALLGVGGLAFFGRLAWDQRAGGIEQIRTFLALMVLSALLVPGVAGRLATGVGRFGGSLAKAWKAKQ